MHVLTKIFVVMAAVLALALSALTMMYSVNAETIRTQFRDAERLAATAEQALASTTALHESEIEQLRSSVDQAERSRSELQGDVSRLQLENDRLLRERQAANESVSRAEGRYDQLNVSLQTQADVISEQSDELNTLRDRELGFQEIRLELEDALADQESRIQVLDQTVRALQEQLAEAKRENEELRASGGGTSSTGSQTVLISGPPIQGRVAGVRFDDVTQKSLVRITLGRNDRMRENAKLHVYRGGTFVADIVLREVDLQESVGEVVLTGAGVDGPRSGDSVTTDLAG